MCDGFVFSLDPSESSSRENKKQWRAALHTRPIYNISRKLFIIRNNAITCRMRIEQGLRTVRQGRFYRILKRKRKYVYRVRMLWGHGRSGIERGNFARYSEMFCRFLTVASACQPPPEFSTGAVNPLYAGFLSLIYELIRLPFTCKTKLLFIFTSLMLMPMTK